MVISSLLTFIRTTLKVAKQYANLLRGRCDCGGEVAVTGEIKRVCKRCGCHVW